MKLWFSVEVMIVEIAACEDVEVVIGRAKEVESDFWEAVAVTVPCRVACRMDNLPN